MELDNLINSNRMCRFILFLSGCFVTISAIAQNRDNIFSLYAEYISKTLDITWKKPKGFVDLKTSTIWTQGDRKELGSSCKVMLQSKNGDFLIMYPDMSLLLFNPKAKTWEQMNGDPDLLKRQILIDMNDALDKRLDKKKELNCLSDFSEYIDILSDKESPFNADTVFIVRVPLRKPYKDKYSYCTSIYACKRERPPMIFRCFFTPKGKLDETKFLSKFFKTIKYRNDNWSLDREKNEEEYNRIFY